MGTIESDLPIEQKYRIKSLLVGIAEVSAPVLLVFVGFLAGEFFFVGPIITIFILSVLYAKFVRRRMYSWVGRGLSRTWFIVGLFPPILIFSLMMLFLPIILSSVQDDDGTLFAIGASVIFGSINIIVYFFGLAAYKIFCTSNDYSEGSTQKVLDNTAVATSRGNDIVQENRLFRNPLGIIFGMIIGFSVSFIVSTFTVYFTVGDASQLRENIAIILVNGGISIIAALAYKKRRLSAMPLGFTIGAITGAFVMIYGSLFDLMSPKF